MPGHTYEYFALIRLMIVQKWYNNNVYGENPIIMKITSGAPNIINAKKFYLYFDFQNRHIPFTIYKSGSEASLLSIGKFAQADTVLQISYHTVYYSLIYIFLL